MFKYRHWVISVFAITQASDKKMKMPWSVVRTPADRCAPADFFTTAPITNTATPQKNGAASTMTSLLVNNLETINVWENNQPIFFNLQYVSEIFAYFIQ